MHDFTGNRLPLLIGRQDTSICTQSSLSELPLPEFKRRHFSTLLLLSITPQGVLRIHFFRGGLICEPSMPEFGVGIVLVRVANAQCNCSVTTVPGILAMTPNLYTERTEKLRKAG